MNQLRGGMPADIAERIQKLGTQFSPEFIQEMITMYAGVRRSFDVEDIVVDGDIAYGVDERQRLDVHLPKQGFAQKNVDVLMFVHGGGFTMGNRESRRFIPDYFAANGLVGVNVTHRLAPEHQWPAGTLDIAAAVTWVHANIARYGGDPHRIYFMGESAGAVHIASYVFRPELVPAATPEVAGAILVSGPFQVDSDGPGEREAAYYGDDRSRWPRMAFPGNITRTHIPSLLTLAEYDPPNITRGVIQLIHELVMNHGVMPRFRQLPGHNHLSGGLSIGTADTMLSAEILDFITVNDRRLDAGGSAG